MSITYNVAQNTEEWRVLRMGKPTASSFHKILSPLGKPSRQAEAYMHWLLAELILGAPLESDETKWMQRGSELEPAAAAAYELQTDQQTTKVGFVTTDDGRIGCSPDRLVGEKRLLQIKAPKPNTHVGYLLNGELDESYIVQLQGELWITEREQVDIISYCPGMPSVIIPVFRDEKYIAMLSFAVNAFADVLAHNLAALETKYGPFKRAAKEVIDDAFGVTFEDAEMIWAAYAQKSQ